MASAGPAFPSTKKTTNYARLCRLLVDVGSQVLRETFDRFHPPGSLDTVLGTPPALPILQLLRKKQVLNLLQWGKLYPAIKSKVTSKNFDITLLMVLFRNICGLTPPATGWDNLPPATDLTPKADIARIKFYRNTVYGHASQASVDDVTFTTCWTNIRNTLVRLGGATYETAIDDLKDDCMDPDIEEHYIELLKQWKVDEDNIKEKLDEVVDKLDELKASVERRSAPVMANLLLVNTIEYVVQNGVVINIYNMPGASQSGPTADRSEEMFIVPVAQEQEQNAGVEGSVSGHIQENQQDSPTELNIWNVILSFKKPLNFFFQYLKKNLNVVVRRYDLGSLLIAVECSSLYTLEELWKDYTSGHLNKMAQETLVTAEVLEKLGLTGIKLKTVISGEEYKKGQQIFMQNSHVVLPEQSPATATELKESYSDVELPQGETCTEITQHWESSQLQGKKRAHSEAFGQGPSTPSQSSKKRAHSEAFGQGPSTPSQSGKKTAHSETFGQGPSGPSQSSESQCINAMFLCDEWMSSRGGLSTFNREFAIGLAKTSSDKINVHCYVSRSNDLDREDARKNGVNLITAKSIPGTLDPLDWLKIPPRELSHPDIVIGHGRKFGTPAYCIVQTTNCKWVQFVHVFCEDLGKYKQTDENRSSVSDTIEENEKKHKSEIELCNAANVVVAVGSRLQQKYSRCLPDLTVHVITPGILEKFTDLSDQKLNKVTHCPEEFSIFVFGRGTYEDLALKGYDIVADAIGSLGEKFKMTFVGSPEGQHRNIEDWFLQKTRITRRQVTIRGYCDQDELKRMFREADLVALPSRTEGFGLVALEAISAGVPILVTEESGIAKALKKVTGGTSVIVQSEKPDEWSQKIQQLSEQKPEERHDTAIRLRENYHKTYSWNTQCEKFKELIQDLTDGPSHTAGSSGSAKGNLKGAKEMPSFLADFKSSIANVANWGNAMAAGKDTKKESGLQAENKGWNLLHSASEGGDVSVIETMLSLGSFDVNSRDSLGTTPLMVAAAKGEMQAVDFLLSNGADPSLTTNIGRNLLHAAVEGGNVTIVEKMISHNILIDSSDNRGVTSLMIAASQNNLEVVEFLLCKGADPFLESKRGRSAFFIASECGSIAVIERLLSCGFTIDSRDRDGNTPLMNAAGSAKIQSVNYLLEKGADPKLAGEKNGWSLLHFSSQGGNVAIIDTLLSYGLDIDIKDKKKDYSTKNLTPLMLTIVFNNLEAMKYLLEKGADPTLEDSEIKVSSLHLASIKGNIAMIDAILSSGFDINIQTSEGLTALMFAAFCEKPTLVDFLLEKGADPFLKDKLGRTFLHYASEGGDITIIEKCLSCGLDIESKDNEGKTPLMMAASKGKSDAVKFLLQRSASKKTE